MANLVQLPTYTRFVNQQFVIEPLNGPSNLDQLTERFPEELYHKSPESHLIRFLQTVLGPSGVGWLQKNTLEARLIAEANGLELFDIDRFYGDPFAFGRLFEEIWTTDPTGLLSNEEGAAIKAKDQAYRSRAIDFMNGARAGNSPFGMMLVARSGLGHAVEIIENYKYLFDQRSDDPIGIVSYGKTMETNEMIILPRQETPRSEQQRITITNNPDAGNFVLFFNGRNSSTIPAAAPSIDYPDGRPTLFDIQSALEDIDGISPGDVSVTGGIDSFVVSFHGHYSQQNVPLLTAQNGLNLGAEITIETITEGVSPLDEIVHIPARTQHNLQTAIDRVKPVTTLVTIGQAPGLQQNQEWRSAFSSSEYNEVLRFVTGNPGVRFPPVDSVNWIERSLEKEAPRVVKDLQYHYAGFDNVIGVTTSSNHLGRFVVPNPYGSRYPYLVDNTDDSLSFGGDRILADYSEPLTVSTLTEGGDQMINGIYPAHYLESSEIPQIKYAEEQFWASQERTDGTEWIILDLGSVKAINFIGFEVSRKPLSVSVEIDVLDQAPDQEFEAINPTNNFVSAITDSAESLNPWQYAEYIFEDAQGRIPLTRYVKINFERRTDTSFFGGQPWTVDVRNLRIGRNVSDY